MNITAKELGDQPAFPVHNPSVPKELQGLTKREYFAAAALQTMVNRIVDSGKDGEYGYSPSELTEDSVQLADHLLIKLLAEEE